MHRKKQHKKGNKKKQQNKSKGKKKQNTANSNNKKKQNKKQQKQPKLKGIFGLDSLAPSATKQTDLLISGYIRNIKKIQCPVDITKLCLEYARNVLPVLSAKQCQLLIDQFVQKKIIKNKNKKFHCIFNAKFDGFDAEIFHKKCNNKGPTLCVFRSNYDYIFGGFCNVPWIKPNIKKGIHQYTEDYHSFLFSFYLSTDKLEIYDINFNRANFAIQNTMDKGPIFGYSDIVIGKNCNTEKTSFCKTSCYKINGDGNKLCGGNDDSVSEGYYTFIVENYEVFQLK